MKKIIQTAAAVLILALGVWVLFLQRNIKEIRDRPARIVTVTVTKIDTLTIYEPIPYFIEIDTQRPILIFKDSLVFIGDSLILAREIKHYKDSTYEARVSGFKPSLDFIKVYQKTITNTVTHTIKPRDWGIGASVGYGITKDGLTPYIGVGFYYRIW